jgi:hypothetical protein
MFHQHPPTDETDLLPWHLTHSLPDSDRPAAEEQARRQPQRLAAWQAVRSAALSQPVRVPPAAVRQRVLAQAHPRSKLPRWLPLVSGGVLAVLALLLLWNIVQPGISLRWSVTGEAPAVFRIYRAPAGSDRFEFVQEVPAQAGTVDYTYVDTTLWPGQAYQYRVEVANVETASATIAANGAAVLPAHLAIIFSSLLIGLAGAVVLREMTLSARPIHWKAV